MTDPHRPPADWPALLADACTGAGVRSVYQPIVDVAAGVIAGYEALVRFDSGPSDPEAWFAAAHRRGVTPELDAAALRSALGRRRELPPNTFLTVNVSPMSLTSRAVRQVWADHGDLHGLVVELTEQTPIDSYDALDHDLRTLRSAGAMIAIDDAGAGYAGLRHLLAIRPEIVKLDRALIADVDQDEGKRALVEMMGTLTNRIDAWLLAEGIERPGELDTLMGLGVPLAQGFLLARPAAGWPLVEPSAALQLMTTAGASPTVGSVLALMQQASVARSGEEARRLCADPLVGTVVLLDGHDRPVGLMTAESALVAEVLPVMRVGLTSGVPEVALRAITRDARVRYTPVVCTDDRGRYCGVVTVERLVHALAAAPAAQPA